MIRSLHAHYIRESTFARYLFIYLFLEQSPVSISRLISLLSPASARKIII